MGYLVESSSHIDGGRLDDGVDDGRERSQEIAGVDLGVEENFGGEEAFVSNINADLAAAELLNHELLEALGFPVEAGELLYDVRAHVTERLLDLLGRLEGGVGLAAVAQHRLHKVGDVATGDGD